MRASSKYLGLPGKAYHLLPQSEFHISSPSISSPLTFHIRPTLQCRWVNCEHKTQNRANLPDVHHTDPTFPSLYYSRYVISTMVTLASRSELREMLGADDHTSYIEDSGQKVELATIR